MMRLLMLIFVLALNSMMFITQVSIDNIAADESIPIPLTVYTYENSTMEDFNAGSDGNYSVTNSAVNELPLLQSKVVPDTDNNFFTDIFSTIKEWFVNSVPGAKYLKMFITSFPNLLKNMGMPSAVSFALGVIWYALGTYLVISLLAGKD